MSRAADLARRLGEQAEAVCRYYLPNGRRQGRYWICGDVMGTPGRSLYVRLSGERAGKFCDAADGTHGDLLDLIALNRGLGFRAALDEARGFLSLPVPPIRQVAPPVPTNSSEAARRLFAASKPIQGTLAERYLQSRGIILPADVSALRFHPRCFHRGPQGRETWPALIAAVTDLDSAITGAHRTWLSPDGGKAPLDQPRRAMGHLAGNAVRLGVASDVLTAAEGIESALALKTMMPAMPVAAALSAAHLAALVFPPTLRRLYVARDNDEAGRFALERLRARSRAGDIDIRALAPRTEDFNADLLSLGPDRLRAWLAEQLAPDDVQRFLVAGEQRRCM
ncbi:MAG: toprim domain-containing protein [Pseudomonadota bacterium]|nr:toprim domain-containing protein [Pseudomonadota bacterium]MEC9463373.1 toprim domain-containing protein [Pseudomonadota bacterium]